VEAGGIAKTRKESSIGKADKCGALYAGQHVEHILNFFVCMSSFSTF
jgi:hypothetical protein